MCREQSPRGNRMNMSRRNFLRKALLRESPEGTCQPAQSWLVRVTNFFSAAQTSAGLLLLLPEYRPDIISRLSAVLQVPIFDFRASVMAARSWDAHTITLDELQSSLLGQAEASPLIAFNIDALLATKSQAQRLAWVDTFLATSFRNRVIVALTIYADEVSADSTRILRIQSGELPEQGILHRMHELKEAGTRLPKAPPVLVLE